MTAKSNMNKKKELDLDISAQLNKIALVYRTTTNIITMISTSLSEALFQEIIQEHGGQISDNKAVVASDSERAYVNVDLACAFYLNNEKDIAHYFYERALKLLGAMAGDVSSINPMTDFNIASCLMRITSYNIHNDNVAVSNICIQKLWNYLQLTSGEENDLSEIQKIRRKMLKHNCLWNAAFVNNVVDCQFLVKTLLKISYFNFKYFYPHVPFDDSYTDFIEKLDIDIMNGRHSEVLSLELLSKCMEFFKNNERSFLYHLLKFCSHGYIIEISVANNELSPETIESADAIINSNMVEMFTHSSLWHPLFCATHAHLALYDRLSSSDDKKYSLVPKLLKERYLLNKCQQHFGFLSGYTQFVDLCTRLNVALEPFGDVDVSLQTHSETLVEDFIMQARLQDVHPQLSMDINEDVAAVGLEEDSKQDVRGFEVEYEQVIPVPVKQKMTNEEVGRYLDMLFF
ncbi:hypothetical protein AKO1_007716 [Acrasis kona]|uniref:Uncharacterized protein n=1 Tax=Acrasis kona TaxID=1008807 RepID=A0AAW2YR96_9EUKA